MRPVSMLRNLCPARQEEAPKLIGTCLLPTARSLRVGPPNGREQRPTSVQPDVPRAETANGVLDLQKKMAAEAASAKFEAMLSTLLSKVIDALEMASKNVETLCGSFQVPAGGAAQTHPEKFFQSIHKADHLLQRLNGLSDKIPAKPPRVQPLSLVGAKIAFTPTPARDATPEEATRAKFEGIIHKYVLIFTPKLEGMEGAVDVIHRKLNIETQLSPLPDGTGARSILVIVARLDRIAAALQGVAQRFSSQSSPAAAALQPVSVGMGGVMPAGPSLGIAGGPMMGGMPQMMGAMPQMMGGVSQASPAPAMGGDVAARMQLLSQLFSEGFMGADEYQARRSQLEQQQVLHQQSAMSMMPATAPAQQNPLEILTMYYTRGLITAEDYQMRLGLLQQQQMMMAAPPPMMGMPAQLPTMGLGPNPLGGPGLASPNPGLPSAAPSMHVPAPAAGGATLQLAQLQMMLDTGLITPEQFSQYAARAI